MAYTTIDDPSEYFTTTLYTGNAGTNAITNSANAGDFQPDWVWLKSRNSATHHRLYDSSRGVLKNLLSSATNAEATTANSLTSFDSNGFTLGSDDNSNQNSKTFVGWQWKANGGTTSSNSDGSITSTVQANTTAGFSIVTYTGTQSNATVGHGLSSTPKWIIVKRRDSAGSWIVWHDAFGAASNTDYLYLNGQIAIGGDGSNAFWNSTVPTNSVFSVGTGGSVNASGATYVAYCWSPVSQFSSFGSYTGNGSSDGTFVYTGHRSRFLLIKADIAGEDWVVIDTERETYNTVDSVLFANDPTAEITNSAYNTDILSNGFKLRGTNPRFNTSGETYLFASFAEHPFKTARAR